MKNMKFFITGLLLCCGTAAVSGLTKTRIANNGEVGSEGEFPYQVSMQINGQHHCGGSLITKRHVLTAAHCVQPGVDARNFKGCVTIEVGSTTIGQGTSHRVKRISYHPSYQGQSQTLLLPNDIAMIHLAKPVKLSSRVATIELPHSTPAPGTPVTLSGFGNSFFKGPSSSVLKKMDAFISSKEECQNYYTTHVRIQVGDDKICAKRGPGYGACQGDSGGPLVDRARKTVLGVVSAGDAKCSNGQPDTYTDVSKFRPYIEEERRYRSSSPNSNPALNFDSKPCQSTPPSGMHPGFGPGQPELWQNQPPQFLPPGMYPDWQLQPVLPPGQYPVGMDWLG